VGHVHEGIAADRLPITSIRALSGRNDTSEHQIALDERTPVAPSRPLVTNEKMGRG
jgi:hypothetical protein